MTIDACKRIIWRIREKQGNLTKIKHSMLEWAIMDECGTDTRTIKKYIKTLIKLKWITLSGLGEYSATEVGQNM